MPVYNAAATIERAAGCILAQTFSDIEMIVVDDGSTDGTDRVLHSLKRSDARLKVLRIPHTGIVGALNAGLSLIEGDFVARMDADDTCPRDRLQNQVSRLVSDPSVDLVSGHVAFGGDAVSSRGFAVYVDWLNTLRSPMEIALNRFVESPVAHPSVIFRRELIDHYGNYLTGEFPEDYELWLRWLRAGVRMCKVPDTVLTWYDGPTRLTRSDGRYSQQAIYELKARYLSDWLAQNNPHHPQIVVWGAGRETRKRAERLSDHEIDIVAYIDIDPRKIGQVIRGRPVWSEKDLPSPGHIFVVPYVGSRGARADIRCRLESRGYREGLNYVCAA